MPALPVGNLCRAVRSAYDGSELLKLIKKKKIDSLRGSLGVKAANTVDTRVICWNGLKYTMSVLYQIAIATARSFKSPCRIRIFSDPEERLRPIIPVTMRDLKDNFDSRSE